MNTNITISTVDDFQNISEEEVMSTWRSVRHVKPVTDDMAWNIIVAGLSLEIVFRRGSVKEMEQ